MSTYLQYEVTMPLIRAFAAGHCMRQGLLQLRHLGLVSLSKLRERPLKRRPFRLHGLLEVGAMLPQRRLSLPLKSSPPPADKIASPSAPRSGPLATITG